MKYTDFRKFTDEKGAQPIYLFEGEEVYFREKGEELLKSRYLQEPTLDYTSFDGARIKGDGWKAVVDAVNSFPFISEKRVVRISDCYPTDKDYETYLAPLFENPPTASILLILNDAKPKTGQVSLAKKPNVTYVDCSRADIETIKKWIYITCKRAGVYADGVTSGKIAEYCVCDMSRIAMETEKLLGYCLATGNTRLTDEIVDELVYPDSEYKIYELAGALSKKNYTAFITILKDLQSKGFNEHIILSSLCSYFKNLYEVSVMDGSDMDIATALSQKEYSIKKNREQAKKIGKDGIYFFYQNAYEKMSGIKSGKLTPESALKEFITQLFFVK